jgi:membrane protease YdiL (CAAX protease family)
VLLAFPVAMALATGVEAPSSAIAQLAQLGDRSRLRFGRMTATNRHHTPYWGVVVFFGVPAAVVIASGGHEQRLVLFYAVAVFIAFLCGLLSMGKFFRSERKLLLLAASVTGALAVGVTLSVNLARGYPIASLLTALLIAATLYGLWLRAGRPSGVSEAERIAAAPELVLGGASARASDPS